MSRIVPCLYAQSTPSRRRRHGRLFPQFSPAQRRDLRRDKRKEHAQQQAFPGKALTFQDPCPT